MARRLGATEEAVLAALGRLHETGVLGRVGAVFEPHSIGASTLGALEVAPERLEEVAETVSSHDEVNHNYEREHRLNLWFVVTAPNAARIAEVLAEIEAETGLAVLDFPLERSYHIDLGFALTWS
jgi:DNA-binding Lrp family transcriptional regulator